MKATETVFKNFLTQNKTQFVIPVYQRNYDWTTTECKQLLEDIIEVGSKKNSDDTHFIGSIVLRIAANDLLIYFRTVWDVNKVADNIPKAVMLKHIHRGKNRSVLRAIAEVNACDNQFAPEWITPFNNVIRKTIET